MKPQRIGKSYARNLIQALAVLTGSTVETPEKIGFITYVKKENDLKTKVKKPVNGYQAKQRKRKNRKKR